MADHIAAYGSYLEQEKHASANTVSSYLRDLNQFRSWLLENGAADLRRVKTDTINDYLRYLERRGKSPATVTRSAASLKSFYGYMQASGVMKANPAKAVVTHRAERKYPEILTNKEVELFLEQPECVDAKGFRDHAMLELLYATGIRVSEVRYITVEAAQEGRTTISLKGKIRTILLPGKLCRRLLKYAKKQKITSGEIFLTKGGKPMGRCQIWAEMKRLCQKADVEPSKVFPHNLRHLFATIYYRVYKDIAKLADILGHSSIETTRIYLMTTGQEHRRQLERLQLVL